MDSNYWTNCWSDVTFVEEYARKQDGGYHRHRLSVISHLIPRDLLMRGKRVFDFGCGDAVMFPTFLEAGAYIEGTDFSPEMIEQARVRLAGKCDDSASIARVGTVYDLRQITDKSFDAVLCLNVLAYLTDDEEATFYREARRVLKRGGYLIVTHSNELFDMFTLNWHTVKFIEKYLSNIAVGEMLAHAGSPTAPLYNIRENPLSYPWKLSRWGFDTLQTEYINWHCAPPYLLGEDKEFSDTLAVPTDERWKLMFTCSQFGVLARKSPEEKR